MSRVEVYAAASRAVVSKASGKLEVLEPEDDVSTMINLSMTRYHIPDCNATDRMQSNTPEYSTAPKAPESQITDEKVTAGLRSPSIHNNNVREQPEESSSENESEDEPGGAPVELLAEFLKAVMDEDYKMAQKLCKMVLLYEPENPEAKEFSPLIEKMLQHEEQQSSEDEDSEETDDEDDEDSSDTDDSDDQSNVTSEDSSEDEKDK